MTGSQEIDRGHLWGTAQSLWEGEGRGLQGSRNPSGKRDLRETLGVRAWEKGTLVRWGPRGSHTHHGATAGTDPGGRTAVPAVGRAPGPRRRVRAEEALLRHQVLLGVHQVPHVVVLQQRPVEGAVQGAGRAQVLVLGRRGQRGSLSQPSAQGGSGRDSMEEARAGLGGLGPRSRPSAGRCLVPGREVAGRSVPG